MNADNAPPEGMTPRDVAEVVARVSKRAYPRLPTAVGFCMLISRGALDRCGEFDEVFGLGYGEECDFCMRVWAEGMEVVCCDDAYVHHYGEASFREVDRIDDRRRRNAETLDRRWPTYHSSVFAFCHLNPMREIQERIGAALRRREGETRPHVLHVLHSFGALGGTELHTQQMIDGLSARFRATVLFPHPQPDLWTDMVSGRPRDGLRLVRFSKENAASVESFLGVSGDLSNRTVEGNFARFLAGSDCEIVHFQHLAAWSSLALPFIAKELGRRVVLSLHDYFLLCPDYNLVRPDGRRCGKSKADASDEECFRCLGEKRRSLEKTSPVPMHEYLEDRTELVARVLAAADALVAPSEFVRAQFARAHGEAVAGRIRVIPH
ncbi:MAG: glycosyltransferase, partial [Candidatus Methylomirabilis sp.]|nr:glycosyltransferase [Deltaproteobacteria bacterium]